MKTYASMIILFLAIACSLPGYSPTEDPLEGSWVGGLQCGDHWSLAIVSIKTDDGRRTGFISLPFERIEGPLLEVSSEAPSLHFELTANGEKLSLRGELSGATLSGEVQHGDRSGIFELHRSLAPQTLDSYQGFYSSGRRTLWVQRWGEALNQLIYVDDSGSIRTLFPDGDSAFVAGQSNLKLIPHAERFVFVKAADGSISGLRVQRQGQTEERYGHLHIFTQEDILFQNGGITLSGTLFLPKGEGPHPLLVMTHGSGPQDRLSNLPFISFLLANGIALFGYDKRGVGGSGGDWQLIGFEALADDAIAAAEALKSRSDIDAERIGIWGVSQGGWIAPLAAARSDLFQYIVIVSGPSVTPVVQELMRTEGEMRADGYPEEDIRQELDLYKRLNHFVRTGEGWDGYVAARKKAGKKKDDPSPDSRPDPNQPPYKFWKLIMDYDPVPVLEKTTCPFLAIFGGLDTNVQPATNKPIMEKALQKAGNKDFTLLVFPEANHIMFKSKTGGRVEIAEIQAFVPEFFPTVLQWLKKILNWSAIQPN